MSREKRHETLVFECICCGLIYSWFKFSFLLFLGIVMYDNKFETKENET